MAVHLLPWESVAFDFTMNPIILEKAKALNDKEEEALKQINAGAWDRSWVDKKLKEKRCEIF